MFEVVFSFLIALAKSKAIREFGRDKVFVTTKLPAEIKGYQETIDAFNKSLKNLG